MDTKSHFLRDKVDDKFIQLLYTPTNKMGADIPTESLPQPKVERHFKTLLGQIQFTHYKIRHNLNGGIET